MLVKGNPWDIWYFKCWSEHVKHSDKSLFKVTMKKLQLLRRIELHPLRWEPTTLTTAPIPLPNIHVYIDIICMMYNLKYIGTICIMYNLYYMYIICIMYSLYYMYIICIMYNLYYMYIICIMYNLYYMYIICIMYKLNYVHTMHFHFNDFCNFYF